MAASEDVSMRVELITSSKQLAAHKDAVLSLFLNCFGQPLPSSMWDWAYLNNPLGEPYVALCYDGDDLVGHYAMISLPVKSSSLQLKSYLSMTTMVAPTHRMHGLFVRLAGVVYERATADGVDVVFGFPNEQSAPGFERKLVWKLGDPTAVVALERHVLLERFDDFFPGHENALNLHMRDRRVRDWRLAKPGAQYQWHQDVCYKEFNGGIDLVYFENKKSIERLPEGVNINVLIPASFAGEDGRMFDYRFGGLSLAATFDHSRVAKQLILSDVF